MQKISNPKRKSNDQPIRLLKWLRTSTMYQNRFRQKIVYALLLVLPTLSDKRRYSNFESYIVSLRYKTTTQDIVQEPGSR